MEEKGEVRRGEDEKMGKKVEERRERGKKREGRREREEGQRKWI